MSVNILAESLNGLDHFFAQMPDIATNAARLAINDVAKGQGLAVLREAVNADVAFPRGYVNDHLGVVKSASNADLTAIVAGRDRPTSLARFAPGQTPENSRKNGVRVMVKPGHSKLLAHAWLMRLKSGNTGLAIRLRPGEVLRNKRDVGTARPIGKGVYLLYGPSVDQVFKGAADDLKGNVANMVSSEFLRQFARLSSNG